MEQLIKRYVALTTREKTLVLLTGLTLLGFIANHLMLEPLYKSWRQSIKSGQATETTLAETQRQITEIEGVLATEMNQTLKQEIKALAYDKTEIEQQLQDRNLALVTKRDMILSLKSLLSENSDLKVMSFRSIAPEPILTEVAEGENPQPTPLLYKHAIVVNIEGKYFSILKFLQKIEQTSDNILWSGVKYSVLEHPKAAAKIEVYTLSTDREFIRVSG